MVVTNVTIFWLQKTSHWLINPIHKEEDRQEKKKQCQSDYGLAKEEKNISGAGRWLGGMII